MANVAPSEFIRQVRQEASKVTWASRKDTITSTMVVLVMVLIASVFFLAVDAGIFYIVQAILGF